jgi:hypothetical protein
LDELAIGPHAVPDHSYGKRYDERTRLADEETGSSAGDSRARVLTRLRAAELIQKKDSGTDALTEAQLLRTDLAMGSFFSNIRELSHRALSR